MVIYDAFIYKMVQYEQSKRNLFSNGRGLQLCMWNKVFTIMK